MAYDGEIRINTSLNTKEFNDAMKNLGTSTASSLSGINLSLAGLSGGIIAMGKSSVEFGMEFAQQMSTVGAVSGATAVEMGILEEKAREMGRTTEFSASKAAEAFKYMAVAGGDPNRMLDSLNGIMLLATASGEDLALVSEIVADNLTSFGLAASDAGHFADVLTQTTGVANTTVGQLGEGFKYAAPAAAALNYNVEDVSLSMALMANYGIKAGSAGTALRSVFTRLAKPTKESADAMEALGISITDNSGKMLSFRQIMEEMRKGFSGLSEAQKAQYAAMLGGQEAMSGLLAIVNTSSEEFDEMAEAIDNSAGSAQRMADVMSDNLAGDLTVLQGSLGDIGITISQTLEPVMRSIVSVIQGLVDGFAILPKGVQEFIIKATALTGIMGAASQAVKAFNAVQSILGSLTAANALATGTDTVAKGLNTTATITNAGAVRALTAAMIASPLFWISATVLAVSTAVDLLTGSYEKQVEKVSELSNEYSELQIGLDEAAQELQGIQNRISELHGLQSQGTITSVEEKELQDLERANTLLEANIRNQERLLELKGAELNTEAFKLLAEEVSYTSLAFDEYDNSLNLVTTSGLTLEGKIYDMMEKINLFNDAIVELEKANEKLAKNQDEGSLAYAENQARIEDLREEILMLEQQIREDVVALNEHTDSLIGNSEAVKAQQEATSAATVAVDDFFNSMSSVADVADGTNAAVKDLGDKYDDLSSSLDTLDKAFKDGEITQAEYIAKLLDLNAEIRTAIKQNPELANSFKNVTASIDNKVHEELIDSTRNLSNESKMLTNALGENTTKAGLTADTMSDLIDSGYAAAIMFDMETGAASLNTEKMKELFQAKLDVAASSIEQKKQDVVVQLFAEGAEANRTAEYYWELAEAKRAASNAGSGADSIDALLNITKGIGNNINNYKPKPKGGGGSGKTKAKKEEISEITKLELEELKRQKDFDEISEKQYNASLKNMLANYKLNATEKEKITADIYSSDLSLHKTAKSEKERADKEAAAKYKELQTEKYNDEKEYLKDFQGVLKDVQYDEIEIVKDGSTEKLKVVSDEYLDRIDWIQKEDSIYSDSVNAQMSLEFNKHREKMENASAELQAELDILAITNQTLYEEITGLREANDAIKEKQKLRREQEQDERDIAKLAELELKYSEAEYEEREKIQEQIDEHKKSMENRALERDEQKKIDDNNKSISEKQKEINKNIEEAKKKTEEHNAEVAKTVEMLTKLIEKGNIGEIEIPISFKGLDDGIKKLRDLGVDVEGQQTATYEIDTEIEVTNLDFEGAAISVEEVNMTMEEVINAIDGYIRPMSNKNSEVMLAIKEVTDRGILAWNKIMLDGIKSTMESAIQEMQKGIDRLRSMAEEASRISVSSFGSTDSGASPQGLNIINNFNVVERDTAYQTARVVSRQSMMGV